MASPLPPEQRAAYSAIIDQILDASDLNTISAKQIRKGLQSKVDYDLSAQKPTITALILERFDRAQGRREALATQGNVEPTTTANGVPPPPNANVTAAGVVLPSKPSAPAPPAAPGLKRKSHSDDDDDEEDDTRHATSTPPSDSPPASKKPKKLSQNGTGHTSMDEDARIAARLQAEFNASARATRGGGTKRRNTLAKKDKKGKSPVKKKKSAAKVRDEDDSELSSDGEGGEREPKPEKERKGGFHKLMNLSEPLSAMLGHPALSRPQTVKKIWEYVKLHEMQDPNDKRIILCDDAMRAVFKQDKVHMFTMNKLLAHHLHPADEEEL